MKNQTIALFLILIPFCIANGQITIRENGIVEKAVLRPERFDSLENIISPEKGKEHNIKKYLEQEVFFVPITNTKATEELAVKMKIDAANKRKDSLNRIIMTAL